MLPRACGNTREQTLDLQTSDRKEGSEVPRGGEAVWGGGEWNTGSDLKYSGAGAWGNCQFVRSRANVWQ